jgi:photosystem II stability/assembly factor-like uncharacterized protein
MRFLRIPACLFLLSAPAFAQEELLKNLKWRNIGPANMMGRVADLEGVPGVPEIVYVGSASGGVWKTSNGGVTWTPLFDEMDYLSIGDMALEPEIDVVYVGTGEGIRATASPSETGSTRPRTAERPGSTSASADSERITRILVDPRIRRTSVAALGTSSVEPGRGVFVSRDSGATWEKTLFIDDRHGAADIDIDPENPNLLYAAMWSFDRKPWTHRSGSEEGGVFKSVDGGRTWKEIEKGLPKLMGRIGIKVAPSDQNGLRHRRDPREASTARMITAKLHRGAGPRS